MLRSSIPTITFEKQGTAIAEPLPASDEQDDAADDDEPIDAAEIQDATEDEPVEVNSDEETIRGSRSR